MFPINHEIFPVSPVSPEMLPAHNKIPHTNPVSSEILPVNPVGSQIPWVNLETLPVSPALPEPTLALSQSDTALPPFSSATPSGTDDVLLFPKARFGTLFCVLV